jgi:hypothetical protein
VTEDRPGDTTGYDDAAGQLRAAAADLHARVAELSEALHGLVDVAVGVRAEFGRDASTASDPRLQDAEQRSALVLVRLDDAFRARLGMNVDVGGMAWEDDDDVIELDPDGADRSFDDFFLHLLVGTDAGGSPEALDRALDVLDAAGHEVCRRLEEAGFAVPEWGASRGEPDLDAGDDD